MESVSVLNNTYRVMHWIAIGLSITFFGFVVLFLIALGLHNTHIPKQDFLQAIFGRLVPYCLFLVVLFFVVHIKNFFYTVVLLLVVILMQHGDVFMLKSFHNLQTISGPFYYINLFMGVFNLAINFAVFLAIILHLTLIHKKQYIKNSKTAISKKILIYFLVVTIFLLQATAFKVSVWSIISLASCVVLFGVMIFSLVIGKKQQI